MGRSRFLGLVAAVPACLIGAAPAAAGTGTPQFDRCLAANGLAAVPADQAGLAVQVCKTARVTRVSTYSWTLTKRPDPGAVELGQGESAPVRYAFAANPTPSTQWIVAGEIVIRHADIDGATVTAITDVLTLGDGSAQSTTVISRPFILDAQVGVAERTVQYRFVISDPALVAADGSNRARVEWTQGPIDPAAEMSVPVAFSGPAVSTATYFRTASVSDVQDPAPPGVTVGAPTPAGSLATSADDPSSLGPTLTAAVTNAGLSCGGSAWITDTGTLTPTSTTPETTGAPTLPVPPPQPVAVTARAQVLVLGPACAQPVQQPAQVPAVTVQSVLPPAKPVAGAAPVCPRPAIRVRIAMPSRLVAGRPTVLSLRLENHGRLPVRRVVLENTLPQGVAVVGSSRPYAFRAGAVRLRVGTLAPGGAFGVRLTVKASRAGIGLDRARAAAECGQTAAARAVAVSAPRRVVAPAVTG